MTSPSDLLTKVVGGSRALALQENSPKLLFGAGVIGMIGSTVLACRATLKLETSLEKAQADLEIAKKMESNEHGEDERRKDIAIIYARTTLEIGKSYMPSIILGSISIAALTKSHNILSERNAALTAAYAALDRGFREYRARVVERYGEDTDREMRYGSEKVEIVDEETKRKKSVKRVAPGTPSIYARFFDEFSESWSKHPESNWVFLRANQQYFNNLLIVRGHVFLNEVYDQLGLPHTTAGQIVGWRYTPDNEGDNYIDFGILRDDETVRDFINGRNGSILLDFNVDGPILGKIDTPVEPLSWQNPVTEG